MQGVGVAVRLDTAQGPGLSNTNRCQVLIFVLKSQRYYVTVCKIVKWYCTSNRYYRSAISNLSAQAECRLPRSA